MGGGRLTREARALLEAICQAVDSRPGSPPTAEPRPCTPAPRPPLLTDSEDENL